MSKTIFNTGFHLFKNNTFLLAIVKKRNPKVLFLQMTDMLNATCVCVSQMLLSGGVDSTVCAALLHKALQQDQVIAIHIDNGFMRKSESRQVEESLCGIGLKVKGEAFLILCT